MPDLAAGQDLHMFAGVVRLRASGGDYEDVGEYNALSVTPDIQTIEYFSRKQGRRQSVREDVTQQSVSFTLGLNSLNAENMAVATGGTVTTVESGHKRVTFMESGSITRDFQFQGTNDVGQQIDFHCQVQFRPGQTIDLAQDEYSLVTVEGRVLANDDGHFGFWDFRDDVVFAGDPADATA
jgi:hypothetical protein